MIIYQFWMASAKRKTSRWIRTRYGLRRHHKVKHVYSLWWYYRPYNHLATSLTTIWRPIFRSLFNSVFSSAALVLSYFELTTRVRLPRNRMSMKAAELWHNSSWLRINEITIDPNFGQVQALFKKIRPVLKVCYWKLDHMLWTFCFRVWVRFENHNSSHFICVHYRPSMWANSKTFKTYFKLCKLCVPIIFNFIPSIQLAWISSGPILGLRQFFARFRVYAFSPFGFSSLQ